jgi:hypothetical protein
MGIMGCGAGRSMKTFNRMSLLVLAIMRMCLTVIITMAGGIGRLFEAAFQGWMGLLELAAMFLESVIDWIDDDDIEGDSA